MTEQQTLPAHDIISVYHDESCVVHACVDWSKFPVAIQNTAAQLFQMFCAATEDYHYFDREKAEVVEKQFTDLVGIPPSEIVLALMEARSTFSNNDL